MMRKIIPILLPVLGLGCGIGAGLFLRPQGQAAEVHATEAPAADGDNRDADMPEVVAKAHGEIADPTAAEGNHEAQSDGPEFVKLTNQFVIPLIDEGRVTSMVILSLSLQVEPGMTETVYAREPKLRDAFLQVLFDHANAGGFRGSFTDGSNLTYLRRALLERAKALAGPIITDVLISDIARQDA
jgi:hypothetical protein